MYADTLYNFDRSNESHPASIGDGAYLYRLASLSHSGPDDILTGGGTLNNPEPGRFNSPHQRTSYCANNIFVSIAEVLFHMYRKALARIENRDPGNFVRATLKEERRLTIIAVGAISDLIYADAEDVSRDFDRRMCGTTVVFPDPHYKFLWDFNNQIRMEKKRGVLYPSARHSKDLCIAFFYDETNRIIRGTYRALNLSLQLLAEDQDLTKSPAQVRPWVDKLHPTMGYYRFHDPLALQSARKDGVLNPPDIPTSGKVDFVRRHYSSYPARAVCA